MARNVNLDSPKIILYTMTNGLGDYLVMGDVMQKAEALIPGARCLMIHRRNPHIALWKKDSVRDRFFDIYSPADGIRLVRQLRESRRSGATVFGLQMAPGSLQGFFLHSVLKKFHALDYIVDFNLINADIVTPPQGKYILEWHLNQLASLFKISVPADFYHLRLPIAEEGEAFVKTDTARKHIGIHPWSRRGRAPCFVWSYENWEEVIRSFLEKNKYVITIFGKDAYFDKMKEFLKKKLPEEMFAQIRFAPAASVYELLATIRSLDGLITVNTSVTHIGYALNKRMLVLTGPSLDIWVPQASFICTVKDETASLPGADKCCGGNSFPSIQNISPCQVCQAAADFL